MTATQNTTSLERRVADLENTLRFIRDQCTWEPAIKGQTVSGGDERIGPAVDRALAGEYEP